MSKGCGRWTEVGVKGHFYLIYCWYAGNTLASTCLVYGFSAGVKRHIRQNVLWMHDLTLVFHNTSDLSLAYLGRNQEPASTPHDGEPPGESGDI